MPTKSRLAAKPRVPTRPGRSSKRVVLLVTAILEDYAARGVFRGFSSGPPENGIALFRMVWHYDRQVALLLDTRKKTLSFPALLPAVQANSVMYQDLKSFIASRHSEELPDHRRIDPAKARLRNANRRGTISLTITLNDGDFEYAARKLIHTVHEIFLTFLVEGPYYEYMVDHLGLEQDKY
ncbi:MAG TPA: hypothetical protein VNY05_20240 [Candidatus Acidoferrales bacterium]|nr:hypothetical protein [Candidatus Acidoferrales bacterium]